MLTPLSVGFINVGFAGPSLLPLCYSNGNNTAGNSRNVSPNYSCPNGAPLNQLPPGNPNICNGTINYCGGGPTSSSVEAQRSCSPFQYKPYVSAYSGVGPINWTPALNRVTGDNDAKSYKVWASYDQNGHRNSDDYWIFHSGDGAGIEDDCMGDIGYIERTGRKLGTVNDTVSRTLPPQGQQSN